MPTKVITATVNAVIDEAVPAGVPAVSTVLTLKQIVTNNGAQRIFMRFPKTGLRSAHLFLNSYITLNCTTAAVGTISATAKRITSAWDGTTTWNTKPTVAAGSFAPTTANLPTITGLWTIPTTAIVRDAFDNSNDFIDVELSLTSEGSAGISLALFDSLLSGGVTPKMTIEYDIRQGRNIAGTAVAV